MALFRLSPLFRLASLFALGSMGLAGCGGGGGGSSSPKLRYVTDWTNRGRSVTGLSQRIQLINSQGQTVKSVVMNQDANSLQEVNLEDITAGTYVLKIDLYSQRFLGGTKTGELTDQITIDGSESFRSAVGVDATSVDVSPASATLNVQTSKQFYATAYSSPGIATFSSPGGWTWTALGGHASVNSTGLALGLSEGSGSIRATETSSGSQNSATYTVLPFNAQTKKWTVLVYMNAANDLFSFSQQDLNEMEQVAQNSDVRFVVQWKQSQSLYPSSSFNGTRRYLVKPDTSSAIASELLIDMGTNVDMGSKDTLSEFIAWGNTFYPGERTVLIIWNHGNGWRRRPANDAWITRAVSYDDETGNSIQIWELTQALGKTRFDILAWDASLMQMLEVAYEVKDNADYVVGSEESPPGEGYPYHLVFDNFRDNPDASTATLSKAFVDGMLEYPEYASRKITQSVLDTSKLNALATAVDSLASQLIANSGSLSSAVQTARVQAQSYSPTSSRIYRDLVDLCLKLEAQTSIPAVDDACAVVRSAVDDAVVWEGHNSNSANSTGISIDFSSGGVFGSSASDYAQLRFGAQTLWDDWLIVAP